MNELMLINKLINKLQSQSSMQTYQALKLLATDIPLFLPAHQSNLIPAAVLIPFVIHEQNESSSLLLTLRTKHLSQHAGQISFPGGKLDDNEDPLHCALRETQEETGISQDKITLICDLGLWPSFSGYLIKPFVGIIAAPFTHIPSCDEVEEVFEIPLNIAFNNLLYQRVDKSTPQPHHYYELNFQQKHIWGFTAGLMLLLATYAKN